MSKRAIGRLPSHPALRIGWSALQLFGSRIVAQAAGMIAAVIVARALGPEQFGLYSVAAVMMVLFAQFPGAGLDMTAVRLSARDRQRAPARARGALVLAGLLKLGTVGVLALSVIAFTLADVWPLLAHPELAEPLRVAAIAAVALAVTEFLMAALQADERFGHVLGASVVVAALKLVPLVALAWFAALSLHNALLALVLTTVIGGLVSLVASRVAFRGPRTWDATTIRELLTYGGWLVTATLLGALTGNLDVLVLSQLLGAEATGIYASGRTLALPIALGGAAVGAVLLPRFSAMPRAAVGPYMHAIAVRLGAVCSVAGAVLLVAAPFVMHLIYGERYSGAAPVLQLLGIAYLAQIATWPPLIVLLVCDRPDVIAGLSLVMLLFTLVGYLIVVPLGGAYGVALVYCLGCVLLIVPYNVLAQRLLRVDLVSSAGVPQPATEL